MSVTKEAIEAAVEEIRKVRRTPVWDRWTDHDAIEAVLNAAIPFLSPIAGEGKVPEGWQLVPVKITLEMQDAYFRVVDDNLRRVSSDACFGRYDSQKQAYRAMLAAAPIPPSSPGKDDQKGRLCVSADWLREKIENDGGVECDIGHRPASGKDGGQEVEAVAWLAEHYAGMRLDDTHVTFVPSVRERYEQLGYEITPLYTRPQPASTALVDAPSPQSAFDAEAVMMFREGCNYATMPDRICNKCGHLHTNHEARFGFSSPEGMREALEKIAAMRWHEDADIDDICTIADRALAKSPSSDRAASEGWQ